VQAVPRRVGGRSGRGCSTPERRGGGGGGRTWSGLRQCKAWPHYPARRAWLEPGSGSTLVGEGRGGEARRGLGEVGSGRAAAWGRC
jgi:hypothetical protein